jgi:hypothetical protein
MQNIVTIGRRLIPIEHIAFVEPFDPTANPQFKTEKDYKARVVLLNRDNVLTEDTPQAFAQAHGFRMLIEDAVATNPAITFQVETFAPSEGFNPAKPYSTRVLWRDWDGNEQSKLLLTKPETVIAIALRGETAPDRAEAEAPARPVQPRSPRRRPAAQAEQS